MLCMVSIGCVDATDLRLKLERAAHVTRRHLSQLSGETEGR
jgi:hypothetical protein